MAIQYGPGSVFMGGKKVADVVSMKFMTAEESKASDALWAGVAPFVFSSADVNSIDVSPASTFRRIMADISPLWRTLMEGR